MARALDADVVVVGAGFAGLSAATALSVAGLSVIVLEARDRVGGRTESRMNALGERIDTGGQFVNDEMPLVLGLLRDHGFPLVEPDRTARLRGVPSPLAFDAKGEDPAGAVLEAADAFYRGRLPGTDPATLQTSAAEWVRAQTGDATVRAMTLSLIEVANCSDADRLPAAMLADTLSRGPRRAEELQYFAPDTLHGLAEALAAPIAGHIRLSSPASSVTSGDAGVTVASAGGSVRARHAILAVSPVQLQSLTFAPALPAPVARAIASFGRMDVVKVLLRYETAFWRDAGWSGSVGFNDPQGLFLSDTSTPDRPMLVGFLGGPSCEAFRARAEPERRAFILDRAASAFGPRALSPLDYSERDWGGDAFSPGGYGVLVTGGDPLAAVETLRSFDGSASFPVSFAVSDISDSFPGYVEGAIHMGRRAAARIHDRSRQ